MRRASGPKAPAEGMAGAARDIHSGRMSAVGPGLEAAEGAVGRRTGHAVKVRSRTLPVSSRPVPEHQAAHGAEQRARVAGLHIAELRAQSWRSCAQARLTISSEIMPTDDLSDPSDPNTS